MPISDEEKQILKLFAKKINQDDPGAHNNLAVVYFNKGLYDEAIEELKKALQIDPHFTLAKNNLEYVLKNSGYYDKTIQKLEKKLKDEPENYYLFKEIAEAYKNSGEYFKSIQYFKGYLSKIPGDVETLKNLGISLKAIGLYDEAVEVFRRALNIDKNNLDLFYKGNLFVLFQEFTELCIFYSIVANDEIPSYKDLGVPIDAYLIGLCDVIGELRRFCLDSIRKDDIKNSERCLNYMNMLYESLVSLNYPNGLIPTLRHKIDVARVIVERTRGDVTIAWVMFKSRKN